MFGRIGILDGRHGRGLGWSWPMPGWPTWLARPEPAERPERAWFGRHWFVAMLLPLAGIVVAGSFTLHMAIGNQRAGVLRLTELLAVEAERAVAAATVSPGTLEQLFAEAAGDPATRVSLVRDDGVVVVRVPQRIMPGQPVGLAESDPAWRIIRGSTDAARLAGAVTTVDGSLLRGIQVEGLSGVAGLPLFVLVRGDPATVLREWLADMLFPTLGAVSTMVLLWMLGTQARREMRRERARNVRLRQAEKAAALGQLSAGVAHDFNNMLHAVLLGTDGLRRAAGATPHSGEVQRAVRLIERTAERGVALTRRLLDFARRDDTPDRGGFDPGPALNEAVELLAHSFGHGWPVVLTMPETLPPVAGDSATFETVVINLAINARDAMPGGGRIEIAAEPTTIGRDARAVQVVVRDAGVGMDAATLARAGEAFFSTKPAGAGTGLGLSMARAFAERVGGRLEIASERGVGTTVTLGLPLAEG